MAGSGQKSETNETEIKHICRHKRLMLLVDWKLTGKTWNGYTDWANTGSFLMDCQMSPQQRLMTSLCHWPLSLTSATRTEMPDRRKRAQSMHLPAWVPACLGTHQLCSGGCTTGATTSCSEMLTPSLTLKPTHKDMRAFLGPRGSSSSNKEQHTGKNLLKRAPHDRWEVAPVWSWADQGLMWAVYGENDISATQNRRRTKWEKSKN